MPTLRRVEGGWVAVLPVGLPKLSCELDRENIPSSQAVFAFPVAENGWMSEGFLLHFFSGRDGQVLHFSCNSSRQPHRLGQSVCKAAQKKSTWGSAAAEHDPAVPRWPRRPRACWSVKVWPAGPGQGSFSCTCK